MKYFLLFFLFHISPHLYSQESNLIWNEFYQLSWSDFQAHPDKSRHGDAATTVQIKAKPFFIGDKLQYDVNAIFIRSESWYKDKSPQLLQHERLHFDIAELYARKIRKTIQQKISQGVSDTNIINTAITQLLEESNRYDRQYDAETLHGSLPKKQLEWSTRIDDELKSLASYKKQRRFVKINTR